MWFNFTKIIAIAIHICKIYHENKFKAIFFIKPLFIEIVMGHMQWSLSPTYHVLPCRIKTLQKFKKLYSVGGYHQKIKVSQILKLFSK